MFNKITAFIPYNGNSYIKETVKELKETKLVKTIFLLTQADDVAPVEGCEIIKTKTLLGSETIQKLAEKTDTEFILFLTQDTLIKLGQFALERFTHIASTTPAGLVYSDYYEIKDSARSNHPVIDYQIGSLRDDFNFGPLIFLKKKAVEAIS